jgi:hypothetical protein
MSRKASASLSNNGRQDDMTMSAFGIRWRIATPALVAIGVVLGPGVAPLMGQEPGDQASQRAQARLEQALPPGDLDRIRDMAGELGRDGIPPQLIRRKALEGVAKGVPPDRIVGVLEDYASRLRTARDLVGADGSGRAYGASLAAAAEAVRRGVPPEAIRGVAREAGEGGSASDGRGLAVPLLVLGDLTEAGVPSDEALEMVRQGMRQGAPEQGMLNFSAAVRRRIRMGEDPATAFDQVRIRAMERMRMSPEGSMSPSRGEGGRRPSDNSPVPPGSPPPGGMEGMRQGPGSN